MFNIGAGELVVILVLALLVLGPKRLPELARGLGKLVREFRRQTDDVRQVVEREFYRMDQDEPEPLTKMPAPKPALKPLGLPYQQGPELRPSAAAEPEPPAGDKPASPEAPEPAPAAAAVGGEPPSSEH